ncbi:MAG: peptidoglycan editing factor PgeF [Clostridium sp.]
MKKIDIKSLEKFKDFLIVDKEKYKVIFTTAELNRSFDKHTKEGLIALNSIKNEFNIDKIIYTSQVHSNKVIQYTGDDISDVECDGIITKIKNIGIGAFSADCVPIILINEEKEIVCSLHSGWKGTIKSIVKEALINMEEQFGCNNKNTIAYIGAHNRVCCYEVSDELKVKFIDETNIKEDTLFEGMNLNLEKVIENHMKEAGIKEGNIYYLPLCTFCSKDIKLHSYRKSEGTYGRLFTFVILK